MMMVSTRSPIVGILLVAGVTMVHAATESSKPSLPVNVSAYEIGETVRLTPKNAGSIGMYGVLENGKPIPWEVEITDINELTNTITGWHKERAKSNGKFEYTIIQKGKHTGKWKGPGLNRKGNQVHAMKKNDDGHFTGEKSLSKSKVRCMPKKVSKITEETADEPQGKGMEQAPPAKPVEWTPDLAKQLVDHFVKTELVLRVRRHTVDIANMAGNQPIVDRRENPLMRISVTKWVADPSAASFGLPIVEVKIVDITDVEFNFCQKMFGFVQGRFCKAEDGSLWLLRAQVVGGHWPMKRYYVFDLQLSHPTGEPIKLEELTRKLKSLKFLK